MCRIREFSSTKTSIQLEFLYCFFVYHRLLLKTGVRTRNQAVRFLLFSAYHINIFVTM